MKSLFTCLLVIILFNSCKDSEEIDAKKFKTNKTFYIKARIDGIQFEGFDAPDVNGLIPVNVYDRNTGGSLYLEMKNQNPGKNIRMSFFEIDDPRYLTFPFEVHPGSQNPHLSFTYSNDAWTDVYHQIEDPATFSASITAAYNDIVEGTFEGTLEGNGNRIIVSNGRFKIKYRRLE